jgi:hypothetical protein
MINYIKTSPDTSVEDNVRFLEATHLLAEIYLSSDRVEEAKLECEKALKGKRKAIGTKSQSYYWTLGLRSIIMEVRGDHVSAEISLEIIRRAMSDGLLQISSGDGAEEDLDYGQIGKLRGVCPIEGALGIGEIEQITLAKSMKKPYDLLQLMIYACEQDFCSALRVLVTAWSPNSYLHRVPNYVSVSGGISSAYGPYAHTLLHEAAGRRNVDLVEILIDAGANIWAPNNSNNNPYQYALQIHHRAGNERLLQLLGYGKGTAK